MSSALAESITIAGLPARRTRTSDGRPPILFLHGAFVTHESFARWQDALAEQGWGGVAVSYRGRLGVPPDHAAGLRVADYVEDARRAVACLDEAPVLMGHSLGGLVAMKLLEEGLGCAAVLLAPAPSGMLTAQAAALPSYLPMLPSILAGRSFLPPAGTCNRIVLNRMPAAERPIFHGALVPESGLVYRELMGGAVRVDAARIRRPLLVMGGSQDRVISVALLRRTASNLGATLRLLPGRGHLFFAEPGWTDLVPEVAAWLGRAVAASRAAA
ncbi:MAG: lysophospholipase [Rhodobacteraceae bacterium]|nr:lysophospholipase [Paracoccaceae bacterium]